MGTEIIKPDTLSAKLLLDRFRAAVRKHLPAMTRAAKECVPLLKEIRDTRAYLIEGHRSFESFVKAESGRSLRWFHYQLELESIGEKTKQLAAGAGVEEAEPEPEPEKPKPIPKKPPVEEIRPYRRIDGASPTGPDEPRYADPDGFTPEVRETSTFLATFIGNLNTHKRVLLAHQHDPGMEWVHVQNLCGALDDIIGTLKEARPHARCGYCRSNPHPDCTCKGRGWIPHIIWHQMPADLKKAF